MKNFFLNMNHSFLNFYAFSFTHVLLLIITFILSVSILYNSEKLKNIKEPIKKKIRIAFGIFLIVCFLLRRGSFIYYDVYDWKYHLDLGFCNMTNILFIIYCLSGNKKIYNICYYCAFCGPLLSILLPVVDIGVNNYSFLNFVAIHNVVFSMNLVFAIFEKTKFSTKNKYIAHIFMIVYVLGCYGFNIMFNTRYNYLSEFVIGKLKQYDYILGIINNVFLNIVVLLFVSVVMISIGETVLKLLEIGVGKNEKEI